MDLFLVHAYLDQEYASGLEDTLSGAGSSSANRSRSGPVSASCRRSTRGSTSPAPRS